MTVLTIEYSKKLWAPDLAGALVTEDGIVLASHISSSEDWLQADLTENFGQDRKLAERFPDGFTLEWKCLDHD